MATLLRRAASWQRPRWVGLLPLLGAGLCAQPPPPEAALAGRFYLEGPLVSIVHHATGTGLLVAPGPSTQEPCGLQATADAQTRYLMRSARGLEPISRAAISEGDTVAVYVAGPVTASCPAQGHAATIVRLGRGEAP